MNINPKYTLYGAIVFAILSAIGGYMAREYRSQLITEKSAHEQTQNELDLREAFITISEAQRKRAYANRTTKTPVKVGETVAYVETTETLESDETLNKEYASQISQLETANLRLSQEVDRLTKLESSKSGVKRWGAMGIYSFPHWTAGAGIHQDLGLVDLGVYGLVAVPSLSVYSVALNARF